MIVCFSNDWSMADVRSCTVKGQHTDYCTGLQWRYDPSVGHMVEIDPPRECTGCLPHRAEHGLVCWHCWQKIDEALKIAPRMINHLRSVERAKTVDNQGIRSSDTWVLPVPATWRIADELIMLLGAPAPGFPSTATPDEVEDLIDEWVHVDPEMWVATEDGAEAAIQFSRLMQTALVQHPMKEGEHRVRNVRCEACGMRTLLWKPPLMFPGDVTVSCTNCGHTVDQDRYEALTVIAELQSKGRKSRAGVGND